MGLLGSEESGLGSIKTAAGEDEAGGGGTFPGFGGVPPAVASASSAGSAALASRSDHTHAGVAAVVTADSLIPIATAAATATVGPQRIQANWALANTRWYALDTTSGNDANVGFSDTSSADAGTKAKKTVAGLAAIFPRVGAGRKVVIVIASGSYTGQGGLETILASCRGFAKNFPLIVGTATNATASSVAFAGDANDRIYAGFATCTGMNAAGYNPIAPLSQTSIKCLKVGGAAPGFPAEPAVPLGWRIRFDAATTTVALRNFCTPIVQIVANDTLGAPNVVTGAGGLPAVPALTDVFYLEQAGVIVDASSLNLPITPSSSVSQTGFPQFVGIQFSGVTVNAGAPLKLCGCGAGTWQGQTQLEAPLSYFDETTTSRIVGAGLVCTTTYQSIRAPIGPNSNGQNAVVVSYGAGVVTEAICANLNNGSTFGAGLIIVDCRLGVTANTSTDETTGMIGGRTANNQSPVRILAAGLGSIKTAGLNVEHSDVAIGRLTITGMGANPAVAVTGRSCIVVSSALIGSTGNTDVGLDLTTSADSVIIVTSAPTVTGTAGDVRLANGQIVTWAALAATGLVDTQGNRFISACAPLSVVAKFSGQIVAGEGAVFAYLADTGIGEAIVPTSNQVDPTRYPGSMRLITRLRACAPLGTTSAAATVFTLYKNGAPTLMTCSIPASSGAGTKAVDLAHPILFSDADDYDLRVDIGSAIPGNLAVSAQLEGPC